MKTLLWIIGGIMLGLIVHLVVVLSLPLLAPHDIWARIVPLNALGRTVVLDPVDVGEPNPLRLDPELTYAVCQFDLSQGPGVLSGTLPDAFWSVSIFDPDGRIFYSTTNRAGIGQTLDLGIFNAAQTRLLAEQQFEIEDGMLIVESPNNDIFVAVRLAPPHPVMAQRYREMLAGLRCAHIAL